MPEPDRSPELKLLEEIAAKGGWLPHEGGVVYRVARAAALTSGPILFPAGELRIRPEQLSAAAFTETFDGIVAAGVDFSTLGASWGRHVGDLAVGKGRVVLRVFAPAYARALCVGRIGVDFEPLGSGRNPWPAGCKRMGEKAKAKHLAAYREQVRCISDTSGT